MLTRLGILLALIVAGAIVTAALSWRFENVEPERLARRFLLGVTALMGVRIAAYIAANVFGLQAVRALSTGPVDPTNVLLGALFGLAAMTAARGTFAKFLREPDVLLALRIAAGVAFVLAGLVNAFLADGGVKYFEAMGYTATFRRFMTTAEVLGGAALLLPWRWLTLVVAAGLAIDMFGALYTQVRAGAPLDAAAFAMLLRLAPLAVVAARGRWAFVSMGTVATALIAVVGATLLRQ